MHHPHGDFSCLFQSKQGVEKGDATDEVLRAVDRVDNPPCVCGPGLGAKLFPKHTVVWEVLPQYLHNHLLASPVSSGDRTLVGFRLDLEGGTKIGEDHLPSRFGSS